jgi:pilus assembly protein Flp/PilA
MGAELKLLTPLIVNISKEGYHMKGLTNIARRFNEEESGAAMVEYTVLLGIITVAVIATVVAVGGWVSGNWTSLCTTLNASGSGTCTVAPAG